MNGLLFRSGQGVAAQMLRQYLLTILRNVSERTPTRFPRFPLERMNKNIDKRLDNIEERLKLLETSLEARIQKEVQQQIAISNQEFMQKDKINEVS